MASTTWKGNIAFGLLTVPIKISVAARSETVSFNMLHNECHHRIAQKTECPTCNKQIARSETVKGFEVSKDRYVIIAPEELEACEPESNKLMEITEMVPSGDVDPLLFDASYYLEPELAGKKAYQLLNAALIAEARFAIAKITMSGREHTVVIRPVGKMLAMHTMFLADEIRSMPAVEFDALKDAELNLARQLVTMNAADFDHESYHDEYRTKVRAMIEAKASGAEPAKATEPRKREPVIDIMAALQASIDLQTRKPVIAETAVLAEQRAA
jgi:DNA end-binding protein Ku